ncbi:MAG: ABC transporter permease [Acidobacteria bacterium RBG_16_64_8]|nr:MAG: ABC transporter permease [Acidobacteria bacterium RBG_16_64_8]
MTRLILARIVQVATGLLMMTLVIFIVVRLTGDPLQVLLPEEAVPEMYAQAAARLGLDQPLPVQYGRYLGGIFRGDFGVSHRMSVPTGQLILERLPATLQLGIVSLTLTFAIAVPLGVYAAYWRGSVVDGGARLLAVFGQTVPTFWLGILLIFTFAVWLRWLPAGGSGDWRHLILPSLTLALAMMGGITRLTRSSMMEVLSSDYVTFARMKGVPESKVLWKHSFRNAALPLLTLGGTISAQVLTGSVVTETVFSWPGVGQLMVDAVRFRDFPVVQGIVLLFGMMYMTTNLIVDVLYLYLNPRLRS